MSRNRIIIFSISILLIFAICNVVYALEQKIVGSVIVSYKVNDSYVITIPANILISTEKQVQTVTVSDVIIPEGNSLVVSLHSNNYDNGYRLNLKASNIPYSILLNDTPILRNDAEILSINTKIDGNTKSTELGFLTTKKDIKKATFSGTHTDILTFSCQII